MENKNSQTCIVPKGKPCGEVTFTPIPNTDDIFIADYKKTNSPCETIDLTTAESNNHCLQIINFNPIPNSWNTQENSSNYILSVLSSISDGRELNYSALLSCPEIRFDHYSHFIQYSSQSQTRKLILLDLDETLIHSDFSEEYNSEDCDTTLSFVSDTENEVISVGLIIRNGVFQFGSEISKEFDVGIFTASSQDYADAVVNYGDPYGEHIKYRGYRNNCITIPNKATIKDLRVILSVKLESTVIIDNSLYSFTNQLDNGILISSFYNDKTDDQLFKVMNYLFSFVLNADDVRDINKKFFNFERIMTEFTYEEAKMNDVNQG